MSGTGGSRASESLHIRESCKLSLHPLLLGLEGLSPAESQNSGQSFLPLPSSLGPGFLSSDSVSGIW